MLLRHEVKKGIHWDPGRKSKSPAKDVSDCTATGNDNKQWSNGYNITRERKHNPSIVYSVVILFNFKVTERHLQIYIF